jgi:4-amino-4-deoxy-L-arabinose transferase-like glycosyltransferase
VKKWIPCIVAPVRSTVPRPPSGVLLAGKVSVSARNRWLIAVGGLAAVTVFLRFSQIHQSLVGDEVFTYRDIAGRSFQSVLTNVHTGGENSPPLYFVLAWASAKLGDPTAWIRLPSIIAGAAIVPVIYAIGRETVGRAAGLVAAAIFALGPFSFYYGVEARPYATMAFFVALCTLALLRAVATRSVGWWAIYVLAAAGAAYSHYTSIFVLAAQGAWSLWACRDRVAQPLVAGATVVLLYLPWLSHLRGKQLQVISQLEALNLHNVVIDLVRPIAGYPYAGLRAIPTLLGVAAIAACAVGGLLAITRGRQRNRLVRDTRHLGLLVALAAATPVGLLIYSVLITDLWLARGLYASAPAAALVLGGLLTSPSARISVALVTVVLAVLLAGTFRASETAYARPPYRDIAAYLDRIARPTDPVALVSLLAQPSISAEFKRPHASAGFPAFWRLTPKGGEAFLVLDDALARAFKLPEVPLPPAGFQVVTHRHYPGLFPTELVVYSRGPRHG